MRSAPALAVALASGCHGGATHGSAEADPREPVATPLLASAPELITGVIDDWTSTSVTLTRWERTGSNGWASLEPSWPGVIGAAGAAWGDGLHGSGAPAGRTGPVKREGDKTAPAGAFALRHAYGYAPAAPSNLGYTPVSASWQCVDDPASSHYTQILDATQVASPDWSTAETMRRADALYTWTIDVAHNPHARAGAGSCIFFHVWSTAHKPTIGCTAMAEPELARLVAELDPRAVYVLLPRAEYAALAPQWGLPPQ